MKIPDEGAEGSSLGLYPAVAGRRFDNANNNVL